MDLLEPGYPPQEAIYDTNFSDSQRHQLGMLADEAGQCITGTRMTVYGTADVELSKLFALQAARKGLVVVYY